MKKILFWVYGTSSVALALYAPDASGVRAETLPARVEWSEKIVRVTERECDVVFEAAIPAGWHIYDVGPYPVPMATTFDFSASTGLELVEGVRQQDKPHRRFDDIFGFEVGWFEGKARFAQRVRATGADATLAGEIEYQLCSDQQCLRGVWEFSIPVAAATSAAATATTPAAPSTLAKAATTVALPAAPATHTGDATPAHVSSSDTEAMADSLIADAPSASSLSPVGETANNSPSDANESGKSLWGMILEAILWGLAALLTPCVFPMVPMTVSFFMKDGGGAAAKWRAIVFGLFIIGLYTVPIAVLILATRLVGGEMVTADIFNWLATHWVPNVLFFIVFMLFAASLLGAFEIRMPSKLINRSDRGAEKKGLVGIFFLALTLVLVSFSCTGPIVGAVLIKSTQGEAWAPILTMLCFSTAFALPFTLLAFFPRLMERLPKSGGWLNSVKVVLAMVEIALGLKFLSVADQTYHWGILPRELYLAIWIVVAALLGLYLLGKIRFRYDSPVDHIGVGRFAGAIVAFTFAVWLLPGLWGAPLKAISGYLPPLENQPVLVVGPSSAPSQKGGEGEPHLPHGLAGYFDLDEGLAHAREVNKPVFLDFTGLACVNCREMEQRVWSDPEVLGLLHEHYVVVALYNDDHTRLPEQKWFTTPAGKTLKTIGRKNSYIATTRYGVASQPAYLVLDGEGRSLLPTYGYSLSIPAFVDFLRRGLDTFNKTQDHGKSK